MSIALLIPILGVSIPIVAIITDHLYKTHKLKLQQAQLSANVAAELQPLVQQIASIEKRLANLEAIVALEQPNSATSVNVTEQLALLRAQLEAIQLNQNK